ncbi:hypothetical protein SEPCBS119000_006664 [Sporothrix epigloea]|uniref:Aminoglycoside phosphotransferase domain-containing protein n=1 Tax=Sporothrix epigloea TaxID=1892477 RepID=A0ABP0E8H6_9PEZI
MELFVPAQPLEGHDPGDVDIRTCSDSDLLHLLHTCPKLEQYAGISLLSERYLAKAYYEESVDNVLETVDLARRHGIQTPQMIRCVRDDDAAYIVMDRIPGHTLDKVWTNLGWLTTFRLAFQLRRFIRTLRSMTSTTAGSLSTGECFSFWLDDRFGLPARAPIKDVVGYLRFWKNFVSIPKELKKSTEQHRAEAAKADPLLEVDKLVFTHHDLAPRNLLLGTCGQLWLLDWDFAGFYPNYFEYASMYNFHAPPSWGWLARARWSLFTWIAAGRYEAQRHILEVIRSRFQRFGPARRWNIKAGATRCRFPESRHLTDSDSD